MFRLNAPVVWSIQSKRWQLFSELKLVTDNLSPFMQQPTEKPLKINLQYLGMKELMHGPLRVVASTLHPQPSITKCKWESTHTPDKTQQEIEIGLPPLP